MESNNPFEKITAFFDGIPAPKSDLTPEALAEIRKVFREELAYEPEAEKPANSGKNIPISIPGTQAWLDEMRNQFRTQSEEVNRLQVERADLTEFGKTLLFQFRAADPPIKPMVEYAARLVDYLDKSAEALFALRRQMVVIMSVINEHNEAP